MSIRTIRDRLIEFVVLFAGSGIAGFCVGVPQHYVAFGLHGYGLGRDAFFLACVEGGIVGVMLGIPTGLIAYYFVLRRDATFKRALLIFAGSLIGGCGVGALGGPWSALLTPFLTVAIARGVNAKTWISLSVKS
jgi:hypothetical protein